MKVSVIVPVYNVERYLARCLDSIVAASEVAVRESRELTQIEIVCVNDGSPDGSAAILSDYELRVNSRNSRVVSFKVVTKTNGGLGSARNAGLEVATGDYILFVDSDDYIPPHAIASFLRAALASGLPLVVSMATLVDRGGDDLRISRIDANGAGLRWKAVDREYIVGKKVQYCAWNKFYKRELIVHRPFPKGVYEDFSWTTGILCDVERFAAIDEPLYVYCLNSGAVSLVRSKYTAAKNADSMAAIRRVLTYAQGRKDCWKFALRQAGDGLSSTVGQVYKARDAEIAGKFLAAYQQLVLDFPDLARRLTLKARWRLWRVKEGSR